MSLHHQHMHRNGMSCAWIYDKSLEKHYEDVIYLFMTNKFTFNAQKTHSIIDINILASIAHDVIS